MPLTQIDDCYSEVVDKMSIGTPAVASLAVRCKNLTIASGNHGFP